MICEISFYLCLIAGLKNPDTVLVIGKLLQSLIYALRCFFV
jgi:hypothetical protein